MTAQGSGEAAKFRKTRLKWAILTSLLSKVATFVVQVIGLPLALVALGSDRFGVYAVLTSSLSWIYMAGLGIGPGLTTEIAAATARAEIEEEKRLSSTAFFTMAILAIPLVAIPAFALRSFEAYRLFGPKFAPYADELQSGMYLMLGFLGLQLILSVVEAIQAGYQENHINNLWVIAGSVMTIGGLFWVARFSPHITSMILAINVPLVLSRLMSGAGLFGVRRRYLLPKWSAFHAPTSRRLVVDGFGYSVFQLGHFTNHQLSVTMVGAAAGPASAGLLAVLMTVYRQLSGMVSMIGRPLWPALSDAAERGDFGWARRAYRKLLTYASLYGLGVFLVMAILGQWIIQVWFQGEFQPEWLLVFFFGLYFFFIMWEYTHTTIMIGLRKMWLASAALGTRALLLIPIGYWAAVEYGAVGMMAAMCLTLAGTSVWYCFVAVRKLLSGNMPTTSAPEGAPAPQEEALPAGGGK